MIKKETNPDEANCAILCHCTLVYLNHWYFYHPAAVLCFSIWMTHEFQLPCCDNELLCWVLLYRRCRVPQGATLISSILFATSLHTYLNHLTDDWSFKNLNPEFATKVKISKDLGCQILEHDSYLYPINIYYFGNSSVYLSQVANILAWTLNSFTA